MAAAGGFRWNTNRFQTRSVGVQFLPIDPITVAGERDASALTVPRPSVPAIDEQVSQPIHTRPRNSAQNEHLMSRRMRSMPVNEDSMAFVPRLKDSVLISDERALEWVGKARRLAEPLLELAWSVADPALVSPGRVDDSAQWAFGNFMLAWLDYGSDERHVRHLPDASFFLKLLGRTYLPVLQRRPELADLLADESRPEMSLTNDVLQIQLRGREEGYSMIRHHALMLFYAALWLDEPRSTQWLDLYDELVTYVDGRPEGRPGLAELAEVEAGAFADFVTLAPRTLDAASAQELLESEGVLDRILAYQLYAGVAIGLVWREYRAVPASEREAWQREQLSDLYLRPDYLEQKWTDHS
ncbi:MAG: hypothetical protein ACYCZY_12950 [Lacisediminihabitans sp.]